MSSAQEISNFLAQLAPQLDAHLLLEMLPFYQSRGVDVSSARAKLLSHTKRFDDMPVGDPEVDVAVKALEAKFKKASDLARPLLHRYFSAGAGSTEEGYVLRLQQSELENLKASTDELTIRTYNAAPEVHERKCPARVAPRDFQRQLEAEYNVPGGSRKVEVKCVRDMRKDPQTGKMVLEEVWRVIISEAHGRILDNQFSALLDMATLLYETGRYKDASEILSFCRMVMDETHPRLHASLWGFLASSILSSSWGSAKVALELLRRYVTREIVDDEFKARADQPVTVTTRNWLLHWSLFVFFKGGETLSSQFLDSVFDSAQRYHNRQLFNQRTVEARAPHLLRYVVAACLMHRTKRSALYNTLKLVRVCYEYSDALTQFVDELIGNVNFERVFDLLPAVAAVVENDYFLSGLKNQIMDGALKLAYEHYIRTHKSVTIANIAKRLVPECGTAPNEVAAANGKAELWVANLIREAKVVAKIDSVRGIVVVLSGTTGIHQRIYEKLGQLIRPQLH